MRHRRRCVFSPPEGGGEGTETSSKRAETIVTATMTFWITLIALPAGCTSLFKSTWRAFLIPQKGFPAKSAGAKGMRYFSFAAKKAEAIVGTVRPSASASYG